MLDQSLCIASEQDHNMDPFKVPRETSRESVTHTFGLALGRKRRMQAL